MLPFWAVSLCHIRLRGVAVEVRCITDTERAEAVSRVIYYCVLSHTHPQPPMPPAPLLSP